MSKEKNQSLFTIAYDDFIRSPNLTDREFRLYMIMLSYCTKKRSDAPKVCRLTQEMMAGILGITTRSVYTLLQSLEKKKLITTSQNYGGQYPIYTISTAPPEGLCPEGLRGSRTRDVIDYIRDNGGVKGLQRVKLPSRKKTRRTGRPNGGTGVVSTDGDVPQTQETTSPTDSSPRSQLLGEPEASFKPTGSQLLGDRKLASGSTGSQLLPVDDVHQEFFSERPTVFASQLALSRKPPHTPRTSVANEQEGVRLFDIRNPEDDVAETPEQRAERLAHLKAQRKGSREKINDVAKADETPSEPTKGKKRKFRGAGPPPPRGTDTTEFVEKYLSEVPDSPWSLYGHFCRVVRVSFPDAKLPKAGSGKYLRWGKSLLRDYKPEELYEMIRVLVLDYHNIEKSKIFFKYGGTPTPTFEQFYSNAEVLVTYIARGVIAPPAARVSAYADDYNRRKGIKNDISNAGAKGGKTGVDPIEALRDQVNG